MKVKILRTVLGNEGMLIKGQTRNVSNHYGKALIKKNFAKEIKEKETTKEEVTKETKVDAPKETKKKKKK